MANEVEAIGVAAEAGGVAIDPGNGATHLLGHRKQASSRVVDGDEIENDAMGAGPDEQLGLDRIVGGPVATPSSAMHEDIDRGVRPRGAEDVEFLDLACTVGDA